MRYDAVADCREGHRFVGGSNPYWEWVYVPTTLATFETYAEALQFAWEICTGSGKMAIKPRVRERNANL